MGALPLVSLKVFVRSEPSSQHAAIFRVQQYQGGLYSLHFKVKF